MCTERNVETPGEPGTGKWGNARIAFALVFVCVFAGGCGRVGAAVGNVFGGAGPGVVDAHTVYRVRPGCATVAARTTAHGYTILTPAGGPVIETSGIFEGPARVGMSVFRYVPPTVGATWEAARDTSATVELSADVAAAGVELPDVRAWLDRFCGPNVPGEAGEAIPRVPPRPGATRPVTP